MFVHLSVFVPFGPLELELGIIVSCCVGCWDLALSPAGAASALACWTVAPATSLFFDWISLCRLEWPRFQRSTSLVLGPKF